MFCTYCGSQITDQGAVFCMKCGKGILDTPCQAPAQQALYSQAPLQASAGPTIVVKKGSKLWLIPVLVILVAMVVAVAVFLRTKSDEDKIRERIDNFSVACSDMDIEAMIDCMDSKTRKQYETMLGFTDGLLGGIIGMDLPYSDMAMLFGMDSFEDIEVKFLINSIEISGDTAKVEVEMLDGDKSESDTLVMCEEKGDWYIDFTEMTGGIKLF